MAKKKIIIQEHITQQEFKDLLRVSRDPFYFSTKIWVKNPVLGKVPFLLYPYQQKVLWHFLNNRFNIILKFRQAGITELISLFCLWLAMYHSNKNINIISIKDTVAKKVLLKMKYMYKNLPKHLQVPIVNGRPGELGTATEMIFSNGSIITSIPTTENAGRSEALSLLVLDEAAMIRWASTIWASAYPTLSTGGNAIINSTPMGTGNFYHNQWVKAITEPDSDVNPIRLYWPMHPDRDQGWYDLQRRVLGPKRTAQEIDGDFLSSGSTVFDLSDIKAIEDSLWDYPIIEQRYNGQLKIFNKPKDDVKYALGADVATGRSNDYSAFTLGTQSGEESLIFKGRVPVNKYAKIIGKVGMAYNQALVAVETNDVGLSVVSLLQMEGYPNQYYFKKFIKQKGKSKPKVEEYPGWLTTSQNRSIIIDNLEDDIRNDRVICKDPFFTSEAYTFIYDGAGRPVAMGKRNSKVQEDIDMDGETYSDDSIFGKAIWNHIRKTPINKIVVNPI